VCAHVAGNELFQRKNYQEATAHYTEAIEKNPNDPRVRILVYGDYTSYNI
jgi:Flp pilus assembly protein TadD